MNLHSKSILVILSLFSLMHCATTRVKTPEIPALPYGDVELEKYVSTRAGLKMRSNFDQKATVVSVLSLNTKLKCTRETNFLDDVDKLRAPWYYCSSGKTAGWVFAGYTDDNLSVEAKKDNLLQNLGNDTAKIEVLLQKNGLFRLKFQSLLTKDPKPFEYLGRWDLNKNTLTLTFESSDASENFLFYLRDGKPITDSGNPVTFKGGRAYAIDLIEPSVFIWGVRCAVIKVNP